MNLIHGDCRVELADLEATSVDTCITDPPYELNFMGKGWDNTGIAFDPKTWEAVYRVLKPGAFLLCFGGTRTYHRIACAIEDAGFELRDCMMWLHGSGFPKSLDISKAIDKRSRRDYVAAAVRLGLAVGGNNLHDWTKAEHSPGDAWWDEFKRVIPANDWRRIEREVIGTRTTGIGTGNGSMAFINDGENRDLTAPSTDAAKLWDGWGSSLKPAWEPILVCMKPNEGTFAANAMKHGVAGLNIDGGRIGANHAAGRFPANLILSCTCGQEPHEEECACGVLDGQSGERPVSGSARRGKTTSGSRTKAGYDGGWGERDGVFPNDSGGASRYFKVVDHDSPATRFAYVPKASKRDRGEGNTHNTVKPTKLMEYLCTLTKTPAGGVVLDPFAGSFTTGVACVRTGRDFIGIEQSAEYYEIGKARIAHARQEIIPPDQQTLGL
jgi:site-specific DNA-methyltransferase (adenine-specific)